MPFLESEASYRAMLQHIQQSQELVAVEPGY